MTNLEKPDSRRKKLNLDSQPIPGFQFTQNKNGFIEPLGAGGSGIVFKASQTLAHGTSIQRAIKFFMYRDDIAEKKGNQESPISTEDFREEIYNITTLTHQNLVKVISAGTCQLKDIQIPYIITDFISGPTLKKLINEPNSTPCQAINKKIEDNPEIVLDLMIEIGTAVEYIFNKGFSHCDIAPKNIFLENLYSGIQPILGDLGISKPMDPKNTSRSTVFIAGSESWIPETVKSLLETEIPYSDFIKLQPFWDIYSFCKTCLSFLKAFPCTSNHSWNEALKDSLERGLDEGGYRDISEVVKQLQFLRPIQREVGGIPELSNGIGTGVRRMMPVEPLKATLRLNDLVKHPAIFRLSRVPQLTTANHILPGSGHTRYEHTLGTLETMRKYLLSLLDEREFLRYFGVEKIETALICAALSSATRFPLSNIIHEMRARDKTQFSTLSKKKILEQLKKLRDKKGRSISEIIEQEFKNTTPEKVFDIIANNSSNDQGYELVSSMLKSSLDVRVLDFLRRDSHHLGIISGNTFDLDEILVHLTVFDHRLALKETGVSIAEHIVSLRYWLFSRAYWNRPNRSYFAMIRHVMSSLYEANNECLRAEEVIDKNQYSFLEMIKAKCEDFNLMGCSELVDRLIANENKLFKVAFEVNASELSKEALIWLNETSYDQLDNLLMELSSEIKNSSISWSKDSEVALLIDFPTEPGNIKMGEDIYVTSRRQQTKRLTEISSIVNGVNKSFKFQLPRLRIYRNPDINIGKDFSDKIVELIKSKVEERSTSSQ
ncbi:hypothetical protein BKP64_00500 [Marinobacter salinus]|uniref:Protein kinase domain-containing protein n=1 Tax=Marinobacter salinus TaxID=1874317 RepID=A0A1D9GGY3_9GAMM|nr:protein kinase [Marinobacter salinus]AOY86775.1 hypothetical protein BKP64_00500 [Marinobacter salinus]